MILKECSKLALVSPILLATLLLGGCTNSPAFLRTAPTQAPLAYSPYYCYQTLAAVDCHAEQIPEMRGQMISGALQPTLMQRTQPYTNGPSPDDVAAMAAAKQAKEDKEEADANGTIATITPPVNPNPGPDAQPQPETLVPAMTSPTPPGLCPCGPATAPAAANPPPVETSPVPITDSH